MNATIITQVVLGMSLFTVIILILVFVILAARSRLVSSGNVSVVVNEDKELHVPVGTKLLQGLVGPGHPDRVGLRRWRHLRPVQGAGHVGRRRDPADRDFVDQQA